MKLNFYELDGFYEINGFGLLRQPTDLLAIENIETIVEEIYEELGEYVLAVVMFEDY